MRIKNAVIELLDAVETEIKQPVGYSVHATSVKLTQMDSGHTQVAVSLKMYTEVKRFDH